MMKDTEEEGRETDRRRDRQFDGKFNKWFSCFMAAGGIIHPNCWTKAVVLFNFICPGKCVIITGLTRQPAATKQHNEKQSCSLPKSKITTCCVQQILIIYQN